MHACHAQEALSPDEPSHLIPGIKVVARRIGMAVGATSSFSRWRRRVSRAELRALMRARRSATSGRERILAAEGVASQVEGLPVLASARRIAGYVACNGEIPLNRVADAVLARGQEWLLPVVVDHAAALRFVLWRMDSEMEPNRFGIPEPKRPFDDAYGGPDLDGVLVPLLAFDRSGHRLGAGGGYYDRCFSHLLEGQRPRKPVLIGVAWAFQEAPLVPEPWDVRLDWVATEKELIQCQD